MKNPRGSVILFLVLSMVTIVLVTACGTGAGAVKASETGNPENEAGENLTISYGKKEIVISMEEILQLDEVVMDVTPVPKDGEEKTTSNPPRGGGGGSRRSSRRLSAGVFEVRHQG